MPIIFNEPRIRLTEFINLLETNEDYRNLEIKKIKGDYFKASIVKKDYLLNFSTVFRYKQLRHKNFRKLRDVVNEYIFIDQVDIFNNKITNFNEEVDYLNEKVKSLNEEVKNWLEETESLVKEGE